MSEYKSFLKTVGGNEGRNCYYTTRLDTYGCGCTHNCGYCYAKSLLNFRGLWSDTDPRIADIGKIERAVAKLPPGLIVRLGGMSDCFQPLELQERVTLQTIRLLNRARIGYLIVTKSHHVADREYLEVYDRQLTHIQVTVTCLDDERAAQYEHASVPSKRIRAILELQAGGFDVAVRLSPLFVEFLDFEQFNALPIDKCIVEFLRVNSWIRQWFHGLDYSKYTLKQSNYQHLPLAYKQYVLGKIERRNTSVCEDVMEHYAYWRDHYNPNPSDCCNLRR